MVPFSLQLRRLAASDPDPLLDQLPLESVLSLLSSQRWQGPPSAAKGHEAPAERLLQGVLAHLGLHLEIDRRIPTPKEGFRKVEED